MRGLHSAVCLVLTVCLSASIPCTAQTPADPLLQEARVLAHRLLIVDTHIDLPDLLHNSGADLSRRAPGEFDIPRAQAGGLGLPFMAIYVPSRLEGTGRARPYADSLIDYVEGIARRWPDAFVRVNSPGDVRREEGKGRILLAMGMENGAPIEGDLSRISYFYSRGIRYITLAHALWNHLSDAAFDSVRHWHGLSPFGRAAVLEMNRVGIMVDVSHLTDSAFEDVLRTSKAPVIASHSACRSFTPGWERNMTDAMIRELAAAGGVIQMNFGSSFLRMDVRVAMKRESAAVDSDLAARGAARDSASLAQALARYRAIHPPLYATVSDLADHFDHVVRLVGIDHVGIGSDFDGLDDELPIGLKDVSMYPNLLAELLRRGYTPADLDKICSGNLLRVWTDVERVAHNLQQ